MAQPNGVAWGMTTRRLAALALSLTAALACTHAPPPTEAARQLALNPHAVVEGRVRDVYGKPVVGVRVEAIPRGDLLWARPAVTDAFGRFRLEVEAPAEYAFLVFEGEVAVVTPSPEDPARVLIAVEAGETRQGVELTLLSAERQRAYAPGAQTHEP
jgi:hypothetical protein